MATLQRISHVREDISWAIVTQEKKCFLTKGKQYFSQERETSLKPGTLLYSMPSDSTRRSPDIEGFKIECTQTDLTCLETEDAEWLLPIAVNQRLPLYNDRERWNLRLYIKPDDVLWVTLGDSKIYHAVVQSLDTKHGKRINAQMLKDKWDQSKTVTITLDQVKDCRTLEQVKDCRTPEHVEISQSPDTSNTNSKACAVTREESKSETHADEGVPESDVPQPPDEISQTNIDQRNSRARVARRHGKLPKPEQEGEREETHPSSGSKVGATDTDYISMTGSKSYVLNRQLEHNSKYTTSAEMDIEKLKKEVLPSQSFAHQDTPDARTIAKNTLENAHMLSKYGQTNNADSNVSSKFVKRQQSNENVKSQINDDNNITSHSPATESNKILGDIRNEPLLKITKEKTKVDQYIDTANIGSYISTSKKLSDLHETWLGKSVQIKGKYGTVKFLDVAGPNKVLMVGVEMEQPFLGGTDGTLAGETLFSCRPGRGQMFTLDAFKEKAELTTGIPDQPTEPPCLYGRRQCSPGDNKGIQGHYNSCYLDATLFCMFAFNSTFDHILEAESESRNTVANQIQGVLRNDIVNPLRRKFFVRSDNMMRLRGLLDPEGTFGMMYEEKDPEEFLTILLDIALKCDHFMQFSSGQGGYYYPIICEKHDAKLPTTQQLLNKSFMESGIKIKKKPVSLILQIPRMGTKFKTYDMVFPSLKIVINDFVEDAYKSCTFCGLPAEKECKTCSGTLQSDGYRVHGTFCDACYKRRHKRDQHQNVIELIPSERSSKNQDDMEMKLFAVLCINISHYIAYVKCGDSDEAPWMFFDSMADRIAETNIPRVTEYSDLGEWLDMDKGFEKVSTTKPLPEKVRRLLADGYFCFYR